MGLVGGGCLKVMSWCEVEQRGWYGEGVWQEINMRLDGREGKMGSSRGMGEGELVQGMKLKSRGV